ncbi:MAG: PadR family transcriptional regulator [Candidatus Bathyarchaeota archaeon]|nr:PadR family transcriptional regulator [Candidatus Bathyarchaeota archaeon]MCX8177436.1 PadR family transcriptional regulator [Candidatus Bathyarchaeota archaeon]MDW8194104.1 PadR family transcriptional regulator [Nitrososphaerota archaeon]
MEDELRGRIVQHIIKSLLDFQVLKILEREPMWGYKIKRLIEKKSGLKIRHGTLYSLLDWMKQEGFIESHEQTYGRRKRRVYRLTNKGRSFLEAYRNIVKEQILDD